MAGKTKKADETQQEPEATVEATAVEGPDNDELGGTSLTSVEYVPATEAETTRVVEGFYAGDVPQGFRIRFGQQGGATVPIVTKPKKG